MKTYTYALLAAAAATGMALAQTAYTTPVGYSTQTLAQGFNVAGLTLQKSADVAGNFETVTSTQLTDTGAVYAPVVGRTYIVEMTSGAQVGSIFEVLASSISGSTITVTTVPATDLVALGVAAGDTYKLRVAPTLEEIFTTTPLASGGTLTTSLNITNSDIVWVPNGTGGFDKYFLRSGTPATFQRITGTTTFTAAPNVPLIYTDGIYIEKKLAATASLTVSGEVKKVGSNSTIRAGFNVVSLVAPAGLTLRTAGLEDDLQKALNSTNSDIVWVQQPNLTYAKYYFNSNATTGGWRDVATNTNLPALTDPILGTSILIEKRAGVSQLDLNVPASYSNF
ncbi:MAG: hypothetical protein EOP06_07295 [Proteobacteria bacterium]|nr:MAG: hypothetical protein EOP06_07295 [Pseudomonadota bacterium]